MTLESKLLFHLEVIRQQVQAFTVPEWVQEYTPIPAEIALIWQTAPPRMPIPSPEPSSVILERH